MKESHLQELKGSQISDEIISLNFKSLEGDNIYDYLAIGCKERRSDRRLPNAWLKLYKHCETGGWWSSGVNLLDFSDSEWGCFKPDNPRFDSYGLKAIKYEHPKGYPTDLFALKIDSTVATKIEQVQGFDIELPELFWQEVIESPTVQIIITEGVKKTACLLSNGYVCIGLPGINSGCRKELKDSFGLIPSLAKLATPGREFIVAFDMDAKSETKKNVTIAFNTLRKNLESAGCTAKRAFWSDEFKGVDDLIAVKGIGEFTKSFAKASKTITLESQATEGTEPAKEWDGEKHNLSYPEQARLDLYSEGHYLAIAGDLYKFNGTFYEKLRQPSEERRIIVWAKSHPVKNPRTSQWDLVHLQADHINKIWDWTLKMFRVESDQVNPPGINLKNGRLILKWEKGIPKPELIKHSPDVAYTYCSTVSYDPKANPKFCDDLLAALNPVQQKIFLRTLALSLDLPKFRGLPKIGRVRAVLCEGTGSNGKDSLKAALSQIFVRGMISTTFNDFACYEKGQKGALLKLEGANVSWSAENSTLPKIENLDSLKASTTGDEISVKKLYDDESALIPNCVFFFNINGLPRMEGALTAIITRWVVLRFTKTFALEPNKSIGEIQGDPRFKDDFPWIAQNVSPSLINKILEQLPLLVSEGIPYKDLDDSFREVREESCHLWDFVKQARIIEDPNGAIGIGGLWAALEAWYQETGTLEIQKSDNGNGKSKFIWHDQASKFDQNITGKNKVFKGLQRIFPKIKRGLVTADREKKGQAYVSGISFIQENNSLSSHLDGEGLSASQLSSLILAERKEQEKTVLEDKNGSARIDGRLETLPSNNGRIKPEKLAKTTNSDNNMSEKKIREYSRAEIINDIHFWREGAGMTVEQLTALKIKEFGDKSSESLTEGELLILKDKIIKSIPLKAKAVSTF